MISLKNYFKETSVKVKKFGLALKALVATIAGSAFIQNDAKLAFYSLVAGAVITFLLDLLPPDDNQGTPGAASSLPGAGVAALLVLLLAITGCTVLKPEVDRTKTDSTFTSYHQVQFKIKGATVFAGLNIDSLYHAAILAKQAQQADSLQALKLQLKYKTDSLAAVKANKPLPSKPLPVPAPIKQYLTDPQTKAQLTYWVDQYGKLQIGCQAKDQTIQTLQAQVTRLTTDKTVTVQVVNKTPEWNKFLMIIEGVVIAVLILIIVIKNLL